MSDITTLHSYRCDLNSGPCQAELYRPLMHQDALADTFQVAVCRGVEPVDLADMSVYCYLYFLSTRQMLPLIGTVDGHVASVTLTEECYAQPGWCSLAIQLQYDDVRHTVLKVDFAVKRTGSEHLVNPGDCPTLADLIARIEALEKGGSGGSGGTGTVTSVNGVQPDDAGNVEIDIPEPPTKLEELEDDAEHRLVSDTEKTAWNAKSTFSGKYADLTGKPTKVSAFENDAGYAKQDNVDALTEEIAKLPNDPTLIDNVSINVPIVKVAEQPTFVNGIEECTDMTKMYVLPNGHLAAYMKTEVTTEGSVTPDYTNILSTLIDVDGNIYNGIGYKPDTRLSTSSGTSDQTGYIAFGFIPFQKGDVIRVKGINWISDNGAGNGNYSYVIWYEELGTTNKGSARCNAVTDGVTTAAQFAGVTFAEDNGVFTVDTTNWNNSGYTNVKYMRICGYGNGDDLIVTKNQEIKDIVIPGGTETVTEWTDTGIEYNQPPDYSQRVTTLETKTVQLRNDVNALENKVGAGVGVAAGMTAFDVPAYAPAQLPADGSETADFDLRTEATIDGEKTLTTAKAYAYMDALVAKKPTYIIKQTMGKDESGDYDCNRYILANTYWKAWYKDGNPPMFAWKNDSTVIYSLSVSPRVGDTMYSTGDVSTEYGAVATVNCGTIAESTRTVNGLVFSRYADGDVEPTIFYTKPRQLDSKGTALWCEIFKADFASTSKGSYDVHADYMISTSSDNNTKYIRYPFGDKKADKSSPIPVFVYANEHGQGGDNRCPSVVLMRMVKDLCENNHKIPFLTWLKDNCILTVIPVANPWGYESYLYDRDGYCNANYVNLNRNFDTPGWANFENTTQWEGSEGAFSPGNYVGSENETQYLMNTLHLSKAKVAFSMHGIPSPSATAAPYNLCTTIKGCGFDLERARSIEETLWNDYNCQVSWAIDEEQDYDHCAKSCAYIQYHGVVGGLTETIDWEESLDEATGLAARYTSKVMEQGYTELLRCLQVWIEEALLKVFGTEG